MRASRLLTILISLQLRGRVTAQALADQLEVSRRTIYRDIDELSAAGVPVYADRGPSGGFALLDGFRTELTGLTQAETEALLLAGVPAAAADLGLAGAASAVRVKLLASAPGPGREGARRVADRFHLDPMDWYRRARAPTHLQAIARCVWEDRRVEVTYQSWNRTSRAVVDPLGLVLKAGRWYMVGRRGGRTGTYRLDKVLGVAPGEPFTRPEPFDLARFWQGSVTRFEAGLRRGTATLRASPDSLDLLDRLGDDMAEPLRAATPGADGWRQATVPIEGVGHAAGLLLGLADAVEVLSPPELRAELARRARRVLGLYGGGPAAPGGNRG